MLPKNPISTHPGEILVEEFLKPLGISQVALAEISGYGSSASMNLSEAAGGHARGSPGSARL
jgi:plasmid maintenance system antidote protein VapI